MSREHGNERQRLVGDAGRAVEFLQRQPENFLILKIIDKQLAIGELTLAEIGLTDDAFFQLTEKCMLSWIDRAEQLIKQKPKEDLIAFTTVAPRWIRDKLMAGPGEYQRVRAKLEVLEKIERRLFLSEIHQILKSQALDRVGWIVQMPAEQLRFMVEQVKRWGFTSAELGLTLSQYHELTTRFS